MPAGTVVWWNVQRLFRPGSSPLSRALDATPADGWTAAAYKAKVAAIAAALKAVCPPDGPAILGLCEVEDSRVVADIVSATGWDDLVEAVPPDESLNGSDVAVLYARRHFAAAGDPRSHNVHNRFSTRDILEVPLAARDGTELLVIANHWPSRLYPRAAALRLGLADYTARLVRNAVKFGKEELVDARGRRRLPARSTLERRWGSRVLVMGDFNDAPYDESVELVLGATRERAAAAAVPRLPAGNARRAVDAYLGLRPRVFNPCWPLLTAGDGPSGTLSWEGDWFLLDQILVSHGLLGDGGVRFEPGSMRILTPPGLLTRSGRPRAFDPKTRTGASDHLPLACELELPA